MIVQTKIDSACIGEPDDYNGRSCEGNIDKECLEAGEYGGVCEFLCVNKVLIFERMPDDIFKDC